MKTSTCSTTRTAGIVAATLLTSMVVASCATAPSNPAGSAEVRSKLDRLQSDATLVSLVPVEIREAEASVVLAEQPVGKDVALGKYRVYIADRKVEIASAKASTRLAEEQRIGLSQARDDARLDARTREADKARSQAAAARSATDSVRASAALAASDAADDALVATENAEELQRQIDVLEAEATDRGLVLTLGSMLFATGRSDLNSGETASLDKLVVFLDEYPDRKVAIEGHTDDVGNVEMNQTLSQHRADSVKSYLIQKGIRTQRISAAGMGETQPIADNQSPSGRQQNRRVEVIIENAPSAIPAASIN